MTYFIKYWYYIVIAVLVSLLLFKGCGKTTETITVTTPEIIGQFKWKAPEYVDVGSIKVPQTIEFKDAEIKTEYPTNNDLISKYRDSLELLNDSIKEIKRFQMFADAVQIKDFKNTFEDENIKINLTGRVQGDLLGITPKYTIKSQEVETEVERKGLRVLLGGGIGNNTSFNDFSYRANIGFQNAKGHIIRGGYSKMHSEDYIYFDYDFSLFQIK